MRVFVLCTGRCGSVTFAESFAAADNFTVAHEGRTQDHPRDRFSFPDQHIEVDNRLSWFLGELDARFGDEATYVHLRRDPDAVARSYAARWPPRRLLHDPGIIGAYAHGVFKHREWEEDERLDLARSYVDTVTSNIELFLRGRPLTAEARLETLPDDVGRIWDQIGAVGDRDRAIETAGRTFNSRAVPVPPLTRVRRSIAYRVRGRVTPRASGG